MCSCFTASCLLSVNNNLFTRLICACDPKFAGYVKGMVIYMDQDKREKGRQKKEQEKFNNVTKSVKPENQNQEHNVREEGIGRQNKKD